MTVPSSSDRSGIGAGDSPETVSLAWVLAELIRGRKVILGLVGVAVLAAVVSAFTKKPSFSADFTFVPESADDSRSSALAGLAGQFGIPLGAMGGQAKPPQFYADLLETREVLSTIALDSVTDVDGKRKPIYQFMHIESTDPTVRQAETINGLRSIISSSVDTRTTGVTTVWVRTPSAKASYEIADKLIAELNRFNRERRQSRARDERQLAAQQLKDARAALQRIDDSLAAFDQGNRVYGGASRLSFQRDRMQSEQALRRDIVRAVSQQLEEARIREVRDTPVITIIDRPVVPAERDGMGRIRTLILWTMAALVLGIMIVLGRAVWSRTASSSDPAVAYLRGEMNRALRFKRG